MLYLYSQIQNQLISFCSPNITTTIIIIIIIMIIIAVVYCTVCTSEVCVLIL